MKFCGLKNKVVFGSHLTLEDFIAVAKEFMYMYYGDGYEEIWEYI